MQSISCEVIELLSYTTIELTSYFDPKCSVETQIKIQVENRPNDIYLPTIITPNGDGINDIWKPFHDPGIEILHFSIYDRWGGEIFQSDGTIGWDGTINGRAVDQGVYVVVLEYVDVNGRPTIVAGDLTVVF